MTTSRNTEAAITRALTAATADGLQIARFTVARDGSVTVEAAPPKPIDSPTSNVQRLQPKAWAKG
jgi:hypothetical protein